MTQSQGVWADEVHQAIPITQMVAVLEAEIADGDMETITLVAEEHVSTSPDIYYSYPMFVKLTRIEIGEYTWGKLYLQ